MDTNQMDTISGEPIDKNRLITIESISSTGEISIQYHYDFTTLWKCKRNDDYIDPMINVKIVNQNVLTKLQQMEDMYVKTYNVFHINGYAKHQFCDKATIADVVKKLLFLEIDSENPLVNGSVISILGFKDKKLLRIPVSSLNWNDLICNFQINTFVIESSRDNNIYTLYKSMLQSNNIPEAKNIKTSSIDVFRNIKVIKMFMNNTEITEIEIDNYFTQFKIYQSAFNSSIQQLITQKLIMEKTENVEYSTDSMLMSVFRIMTY